MEYDKKFLNEIKSESYVSKKVERRYIDNKGYGLFANEFIKANEIISISGGIIINRNDFIEMKNQGLDYSYHITDDFLICPLNPSDPSDDWRMNHCCEPNCGLNGNIIFVAIRDIQKDEELTYDYCMTESDSRYKLNLHCDKFTCRKILSGDDWKDQELQKKYGKYFSNYIKNKFEHK